MCKLKKDVRQEILSVCSDLVEAVFHEEGGEQLWVGIVPGSSVRDLTLRLSREVYHQESFKYRTNGDIAI